MNMQDQPHRRHDGYINMLTKVGTAKDSTEAYVYAYEPPTPDVELALGRTAPVDYGMRGVLYDLTQFEDYPEVIGRFQQNAVTPYTYKGGVYGLPVTQSFLMMFVRI